MDLLNINTRQKRDEVLSLGESATLESNSSPLAWAGSPPEITEKKADLIIDEETPMNKRPVSSTVGRAFSPLYAAVMANTDFLKKGPRPEDVEFLKNHYNKLNKNKKDKSDLYVDINRVQPVERIKRTWKNKDNNVGDKVLGSILAPANYGIASLTRADHYDPFSNSISAFVNNKGVLAHELGHYEDFKEKRNLKVPAGLYALSRSFVPMRLYQEYIASKNALKHLKDYYKKEEKLNDYYKKEKKLNDYKKKYNRDAATLAGGFGSYLEAPLGVAPAVSYAIGTQKRTNNIFNEPYTKKAASTPNLYQTTPNLYQTTPNLYQIPYYAK